MVRYVISGKKASKKRFLLAFTQNNRLWFPGNGSMARRKKLKANTKIAIERSYLGLEFVMLFQCWTKVRFLNLFGSNFATKLINTVENLYLELLQRRVE